MNTPPIEALPVVQAKRFGVYTCTPDDSLASAVQTMFDRDVSALVVVDADGFLEGIITRTDMIRACKESEDWPARPVADFMTRDVVTVPLTATLGQVIDLLLQEHIHRVVAVEEKAGRFVPVSVLSAADVVYHMARKFPS
ncbi:MAG: CBS domain-containing protein [Caldilineae bacterium]|nr:MAG: CBS domain-containing protein [Caldilineae bacterium]